MNIVNSVVSDLGPLNVFLGLYVVLVCAIIAGAMWGTCELWRLYQGHKTERLVQEARENDAFLGADAGPSTALRSTSKRMMDAPGLCSPLYPCPHGGAVEVVENFFNDHECLHPCRKSRGCQLAPS